MSPALQTSMHSAGEPSATATPKPPYQTSSSTARTGSPLGFLALGVLSAAMVIVFAWRRLQIRSWTIGGISAVEVLNGNNTMAIPVKKPKLWDLRNGGQPGSGWEEQVARLDPNDHGRWANIMPLSAKAVTELPDNLHHPHTPKSPSLPAFGRNHLRGPLPGEPNLFNRLLLRAWRWGLSKGNKNTTSSPPELQVAVVIIMPSSKFPVHVKKRTSNEYDKQEIFLKRNVITDFSIGIYDSECTWDES